MKKSSCFFVLFLFFQQAIYSQTYVKVNALSTLLTVPHVGVETSIGDKTTFQLDITASFWKSINGKPHEFYIFIPEYRYHFQEKYNGFYVGGHIGATVFNFQKWNYWNTNLYQKGFGYLVGATIGYQKKINENIIMDCFLGGGNSQSFYKGYNLDTNTRYDEATQWNKSGEIIPYRLGVMISYRLR